MAARTAVKTGNWSDPTVWDGGVSIPGAGDSADPTAYIVTIDMNITVATLTGTGAGYFVVNAARTITANVQPGVGWSYTAGFVTCTHTTGTVTINGQIGPALGAGSGGRCVDCMSAGNLSINGAVYAPGAGVSASYGILRSGTGTLTVTGNVFSGGVTNAHCITTTTAGEGAWTFVGNLYGTGTAISSWCAYAHASNYPLAVSVTGHLIAGGSPVLRMGSGAATILGDCIGGTAYASVGMLLPHILSTATVNGTCRGGPTGDYAHGVQVDYGWATINGDVIGGTNANSNGVRCTSAGNAIVNGNAYGATGAGAYQVGLGYMEITGVAQAGGGSSGYGAYQGSGYGTLIVGTAIGNNGGIGGSSTSTPGVGSDYRVRLTAVRRMVEGGFGEQPVSGAVRMIAETDNYTAWLCSDGTGRRLTAGGSSGPRIGATGARCHRG